MNLYAYVEGDPINRIDSWGLAAGEATIGEVIVGGAEGTGVGAQIAEGLATGGVIVAGTAAIILATPSESSICSQLHPMPGQENQWEEECEEDPCKRIQQTAVSIAKNVEGHLWGGGKYDDEHWHPKPCRNLNQILQKANKMGCGDYPGVKYAKGVYFTHCDVDWSKYPDIKYPPKLPPVDY